MSAGILSFYRFQSVQAFILFVVFNIVFIEFYAMSCFHNTDAFICGMHCGKLLVAHLNRAETEAVIRNLFIMTAVRAACHKIRNNAGFGIAFIQALLKICKFFTVEINAV